MNETVISQAVADHAWSLFRDLFIECPKCNTTNKNNEIELRQLYYQERPEAPRLKFSVKCKCLNCQEEFELDGNKEMASCEAVKNWIVYTVRSKREEEETARKMIEHLNHWRRLDQSNFWEKFDE